MTESGELFTFGDCEGGKLGHGEENDHIPCVDVPRRVEMPTDDKVK